MKDALLIEAYSLVEYSTKLQEAILAGYRLDIESNANCPVQYGGFFHTICLKSAPSDAELGIKTGNYIDTQHFVENQTTEEQIYPGGSPVQEQKPVVRRGRKA